jgi:hypothetical protein
MQCFMHGFQGGHLQICEIRFLDNTAQLRCDRFPSKPSLARALDRRHIRRLNTLCQQLNETLPGCDQGGRRTHTGATWLGDVGTGTVAGALASGGGT